MSLQKLIESDALAFAARKCRPALADHKFIAAGLAANEIVRFSEPRRRFNFAIRCSRPVRSQRHDFILRLSVTEAV